MPEPVPSGQYIQIQAAGRCWTLERPADLESLWLNLDDSEPDAEKHIPYWVELWPATLALAGWLARLELRGKLCLDLGCGLGLSALVAADRGAHVIGMDCEPDALYFASRNAFSNRTPQPLWVCMDWEMPGLKPAAFDHIWGGDVFYEQRFFDPLEKLLLRCLRPGGKAWFADPERSVSRTVWSRFARRGWKVKNLLHEIVPFDQSRMTVNVWELSHPQR